MPPPADPSDAPGLPRPFGPADFRGGARTAAEALWDFHTALDRAAAEAAHAPADFEDAAAAILDGRSPELVDPSVERAVLEAVRAHDLPAERLVDQVVHAGRMAGGVTFDTDADLAAFADGWAGAHGALLAALGGVRLRLQQPQVRELARGFFYVGRLAALPEDVARGRLFIPRADLDHAGVTAEALRDGPPDEAVRRVLWKQAVRARDAFAQGLPLVEDLPRRRARALRRAWLGGLEVLRVIERREYDVWTEPVRLGTASRLAVHLQTLFGRRSARAR